MSQLQSFHYIAIIGPTSSTNGSMHVESMSINLDATVEDLVLRILQQQREKGFDAVNANIWVDKQYRRLTPAMVQMILAEPETDMMRKWAHQLDVEDTIRDLFASIQPPSYVRPIVVLKLRNRPLRHLELSNVDVDDVQGFVNITHALYLIRSRARATPSTAAESNNYNRIQDSDSHILDGRVTENNRTTATPPIELYHAAFATFLSESQDQDLLVPDELLRKTAEFMQILSHVPTRDVALRSAKFADILGLLLDQVDNTLGSTQLTLGHVNAAVLITEFQRELGSGPDPSVQLAFSFERYYCHKSMNELREASNCPAFLVSFAGPWMIIMGAVFTTRTIVQRLSSFLWLGCSRALDDAQVLTVGRHLYALKRGLHTLADDYSRLSIPTVPHGHLHPRFFPYITSFIDSEGVMKTFEYVKPLEFDTSCVTFLAKQDDTQVVVKFVRQYGKEAHEWMAGMNWAPKLIHYGLLGKGYDDLALVVMEYIDGPSLHQTYPDILPQTLCDLIRKRLEELNKAQFLFGDLRRPNMLLMNEEDAESLRFIDFDWACRIGQDVRYPFHLSSVVSRPAKAEDYDVITKEHQDNMFEKL